MAEKTRNRRKLILRLSLYFIGMVILAVGLTLNTKVTLGVSPIISVAYSISQISGRSIGDTTFLWYLFFVAVELILHFVRKAPDWKRKMFVDLLQLPISLIFTRFMNLFSRRIPIFDQDILPRLLLLGLAIVLTGIGAALSLGMRIVPNPGDGVVQALADFTGQKLGTVKNIIDLVCVLLAVTISLAFAHRVIGIGLGTIAAVIGTGRVIALFNRLFGNKMGTLF